MRIDRDPLEIEFNFILEAKENSYYSRLKEMNEYYQRAAETLETLEPPVKKRRIILTISELQASLSTLFLCI